MKRRNHLGKLQLCDMIERDEVYKDYPINNAACLILNQLNSQQQTELYSMDFQQPQVQAQTDSLISQFDNFRIDQFLNLQSKPSELQFVQSKNQFEHKISSHHQLQLIYYQDSGGTKPAFPQLPLPQNEKIQQQGIAPINADQNMNLSRGQKDYNKNLSCYISRTVHGIMFGKCRKKVMKICEQNGINFEQFSQFCDKKKLSGINGVRSFYEPSDNVTESTMKKIFQTLFQKILRRAYLRTVIEEGKMSNLSAYIEYKNKFLLNLDQ